MGALKSGYVIQFEEGHRIDFSLWEPEILRRIVASPQPDPELDAGYRVLLDKDHLTDGLPPPTYTALYSQAAKWKRNTANELKCSSSTPQYSRSTSGGMT